MTKMINLVVRIAIAALLVLTIDGCTHDPSVELPSGYEISAVSGGSPSELHFSGHHQQDNYEWTARKVLVDGNQTEFYLASKESLLEFDSEADWRKAILERKADPSPITPSVSDVTRFKSSNDHVIGTSTAGFFILSYDSHVLETWADEPAWHEAVATQTTLQPTWLRNPKFFFSQTKDIRAWMLYVGVLLFVILCPGQTGIRTAWHTN